MTASEEDTKPTTFREAEVLGLRLMQEGQFDEALKGKDTLMIRLRHLYPSSSGRLDDSVYESFYSSRSLVLILLVAFSLVVSYTNKHTHTFIPTFQHSKTA